MQLSNTSPAVTVLSPHAGLTGRCKTRRDGARERLAAVGNKGTTEFSLGIAARELGYVTYRQGYGYFVSHPPGYE
jgi:hypothetical protein